MRIYHYHPDTKEYLGNGKARLSPLDAKEGNEVFLIPANATEIVPPKEVEGKARVFENNAWKYVDFEVVAQKDTTNTSPSTQTAFQQVATLLQLLQLKVDEMQSDLDVKNAKIAELEVGMNAKFSELEVGMNAMGIKESPAITEELI